MSRFTYSYSFCIFVAELLYTVFMKIRDEDEKVKLLAFQRLLRFPMKLLHSNFRARDWKLIFYHAMAHERSHIYYIAKVWIKIL